MAAIDLQDAYYSIPIRSLDGKFLRFIWEGTLYEFTCLPNGLSCAPRIFTKILKPPLSCHTSWWHLLARTNLWPMCQKCYRRHCIVWQIRVGCTSREVCFHTHPSPHDPGVCIKFSNNDTSAYQGNALTVPPSRLLHSFFLYHSHWILISNAHAPLMWLLCSGLIMQLSIETPTRPPSRGQGGDLTWHHYKS